MFCVNERIVVEIETPQGMVALVLVGATNVGQMSLSFDSTIRSNIGGVSKIREFNYSSNTQKAISLKRGEELGIFHMGSTVVMVYPPQHCTLNEAQWGELRGKFLNQKTKVASAFF